MKQRLIDANALTDKYGDWYIEEGTEEGFIGCLKQLIDEQPTVDAEPVRHGKWELAEYGWYCSACELYPPFDCDPEEEAIPYCPLCGAKMDAK